mmetsp:Transcript_32354/g.93072  ORF Transcript_32354/g.93072 Transcript_32354/m.93072 type:complete len:439 (+) Transcript_32354:124-1440(+)
MTSTENNMNVDDNEEERTSKKRPRSEEESSADPAAMDDADTDADPPAAAPAPAPAAAASVVKASISPALAAAAAQHAATMGWHGLYSIFSVAALATNTHPTFPDVAQVQQAVEKTVADSPPFAHMSKTDSALQLKMDTMRLEVKGGLRGYRMSRASHGISQGNYYYEVLIKDPPKPSEIASQFPSNVRLNPKLQAQLDAALQLEKEGKPVDPSGFGGHVRLGFSNRTGDLQAPVGYDKWSYGIRDIGGSKIHASQRDDHWGGESFKSGDVIGCAISLRKDKESAETNQICFFKNGQPMGNPPDGNKKQAFFVPAFEVPDGVYYPAVSLYMGATVQVNLGPHFYYPLKRSTPKFKPVSDLCERPISVEDALAKAQKEKVMRRTDMQKLFSELVATEVKMLQEVYTKYRQQHVEAVWKHRTQREAKTEDLEEDEFFTKSS